MEKFNWDIAHVLQNRDFSLLQELVSHWSNIRANTNVQVEGAKAHNFERIGKRKQTDNKISELQEEIECMKSEMRAVKLQQKIVDKKIVNAVKQNEMFKDVVERAKLKRDSLSLEIVDLQQESEKRKEQKLSTWNAIKLACHAYKQHLDFSIHFIDAGEREEIKVSFFICDVATKGNYIAHLVNFNKQWKVELIQPKLKAEHLAEFKGIVEFSKQSEISDVTAFLCKLRHIFVKHYLDMK